MVRYGWALLRKLDVPEDIDVFHNHEFIVILMEYCAVD
jgi:hypothetical protein